MIVNVFGVISISQKKLVASLLTTGDLFSHSRYVKESSGDYM